MQPRYDYEQHIGELIQAHRSALVPVSLSSIVTLNLGQTVPCDDTTLCAPYRRAMLISALRFRVSYTPLAAPGDLECVSSEALSFAARIRVGSVDLTGGFAPCIALSRRERYFNGEIGQTGGGGTAASGSQLTQRINPDQVTTNQYTWKFDVPLLVPPNVPISVHLQRASGQSDDGVFGGGVTVTDAIPSSVTVVGAYFKDKIAIPKKIKVPYAFTYLDPTSPLVASSGVVLSGEVQFKNTLGVLFEAWRLTGHLYLRSSSFSGVNPTNAGVEDYLGPEALVNIQYSPGPNIVDPEKPFSSVFDSNTRSFEMPGFGMPSLSTLTLKTKKGFAAGFATVNGEFPIYGLLGTREVSW